MDAALSPAKLQSSMNLQFIPLSNTFALYVITEATHSGENSFSGVGGTCFLPPAPECIAFCIPSGGSGPLKTTGLHPCYFTDPKRNQSVKGGSGSSECRASTAIAAVSAYEGRAQTAQGTDWILDCVLTVRILIGGSRNAS